MNVCLDNFCFFPVVDCFIDVEHSTAAPLNHGPSLQSRGLQYEGFEPAQPEDALDQDPVREFIYRSKFVRYLV